MATSKGRPSTLADDAGKILCADPDINELTPGQLNALHLCKYEMMSAVRRLYMKIDPEKADALIKKYISAVIGGGKKARSE